MITLVPERILARVWCFVRGDTTTQNFEDWVYSTPDLESLLGSEFYLDVIGADYGDRNAVFLLKKRLGKWACAAAPLACQCITLPNLAVVDMGGDLDPAVFETLQVQAARGDPFWWLSCYCCSACGQGWLVAAEERQNDVYCLRRLGEAELASTAAGKGWPSDFDRYESLLRIGLDADRQATFVDPLISKSLRRTIEDLAKARPGIRVSELAQLLNLDLGTASLLAHSVEESTGVTIKFDEDDTPG